MSESDTGNMDDRTVRRLIGEIDGFHGNQLKDRTEQHIAQEVRVIQRFLTEEKDERSKS